MGAFQRLRLILAKTKPGFLLIIILLSFIIAGLNDILENQRYLIEMIEVIYDQNS